MRLPRQGGKTKFNYFKLWNLALDGLFSFSSAPLKIWSYFGLVVSFFATIYMIYMVSRTMVTGIELPGYASTLTIMLFFNGLIMISLGALGEYVSRIFVEVKQRPIYIINELEGFEKANQENSTVLNVIRED